MHIGPCHRTNGRQKKEGDLAEARLAVTIAKCNARMISSSQHITD